MTIPKILRNTPKSDEDEQEAENKDEIFDKEVKAALEDFVKKEALPPGLDLCGLDSSQFQGFQDIFRKERNILL